MLNLNWYIGDNIGTDVILTSPANPGEVHDYDNNKYAVLHEIVHAYISVINKDIDLLLTEGVALYLSTFIYSHLLKFSPSHYVCNHSGTMTSADFSSFVVTTSFILRFHLLTRPPLAPQKTAAMVLPMRRHT